MREKTVGGKNMESKKWYTSKTLWLGMLIIAGGIAEYISGLPAGVSISTIVAGALSIVIRFLTNQPVGK
mgnify:CR=1 FL=1